MKNEAMPLVSILTPCYNGGRYLDRYFHDILSQDYPNCEIILMDDGSTDNTKDIVEKYRPLLERKNYVLRYYYHHNIGIGGTIAKGVKYVRGVFLTWPDCDDGMVSNCISCKVKFLLEHPQYGLVRTNGVIEDENGCYISDLFSPEKAIVQETHLFENYLFGRGAWFQPGSFMIRMAAFDAANPNRYIYPTRRGQNWQMLLPVMYYYECGCVTEKLFHYVKHSDSLSSTVNETYEQAIQKQCDYEELIIETLKHMNTSDCSDYIEKVKTYYCKKKITVAFQHKKRKDAKKYYLELKKRHEINWKDTAKVRLIGIPFIETLYNRVVGGNCGK